METEFNNLLKEFEKSKKVIEENGIPNFFIRSLYVLEDKIKNFSSEEKQKLSGANSKSMVAISRKIKKLSSEVASALKTFAEVYYLNKYFMSRIIKFLFKLISHF